MSITEDLEIKAKMGVLSVTVFIVCFSFFKYMKYLLYMHAKMVVLMKSPAYLNVPLCCIAYSGLGRQSSRKDLEGLIPSCKALQ